MPAPLHKVPEELTRGRLKRLGEGVGKVVYASAWWVVKRERPPGEVVALILLWKLLRRWAHRLPFGWGDRLLRRPSRVIRFLRVVTEAAMGVVPKSLWYTAHVAQVLRVYRARDRRGARLARERLSGTGLVPRTVAFPPTVVLTEGWPGWLTVSEATERVEETLDRRLESLARARDFDELELWLNRFIDVRHEGWRRGLFSVDAHLKNFGVIGDHVVLLDSGGLTDRWSDVEARLARDEHAAEPHVLLGLGGLLTERPDLAQRFNGRWKAEVSLESVRKHWPEARQI